MLECLSLDWSSSTNDVILQLASSPWPFLKTLKLTLRQIITDASLIKLLQSMPKLVDLSLGQDTRHVIRDSGLVAMHESCPQLQRVAIWNNDNSPLFSANCITEDGLLHFIRLRGDALTTLCILCDLATPLDKTLFTTLRRSSPNIALISLLSCDNIGRDCIEEFFEMIRACRYLKSIHLWNCHGTIREFADDLKGRDGVELRNDRLKDNEFSTNIAFLEHIDDVWKPTGRLVWLHLRWRKLITNVVKFK
jgi:hypothetical protein